MNRIIVITTDFGDRFATSQVVGVIRSVNSNANVVIAEDSVTPFSILEGAFIIWQLSRFFPKGSIHLGVVDPGVGSSRKGVIIQSNNFFFVGPDNGLFYPAASKDGIIAAHEIDLAKLGNVTPTFHGRDVFSKVSAYLTQGIPVEEYSKPMNASELVQLEFKENQVVHVDPYGNIKIFNPAGYDKGQQLTIEHNGQSVTLPFAKTFAEVSVGSYLSYKGSHDLLEIAVNQGNAAQKLGVRVEDVLTITSK